MNQDDIDPEFPLSHSFLWLIMHFSSNNHCTCRNGQIRVVKDIDSSVMQFCLCYDSFWSIWKADSSKPTKKLESTAIEYSHDFASGHIHLDLNFLWITFSIKVYLGWILALLQLWALRKRTFYGSARKKKLGFFVLLLLWVVTQNFSSQFHTLDYNTRFYGLTLQSLLGLAV